MKYIVGMYIVMAMMVCVTFISGYLLNGEYWAIASWLITALFFFGTLFYINARYIYSKNKDES
ncbi:hypothetical protein [Bacillus sp. KH172YL63]|uniref:hypothetical protein n=1 Tax=Bacillus sp. KH172YL63 TaxID=2709784 RepID=UPI0013E4E9EA|nr:hypothetical protein [Bacillus sp. KH172YL63]BCB04111.1 hypothetical protein KH172YL63_22440 [Bacillus sp. KH172YL63]